MRTVIPVRPEDYYLLSRCLDEFVERTSPVVPMMDQLRTVHDRLELATAEAAGVPVPETRVLFDVERWDQDLIVKSRYNVLADASLCDFGSADLDLVKDVVHVGAGQKPDGDALRQSMGHDPIVQEFVHRDGEYLFAGLYDHGDLLATFQHRQIAGTTTPAGAASTGGPSTTRPSSPSVGRCSTTSTGADSRASST